LSSGLYLANRAKGIHKPRGWTYALSIRETLSGGYEDKEPEWLPNGAWRYHYYQEGQEPSRRDEEFTNRGLVACIEAGVPVAVIRQTASQPKAQYSVLGLAYVRGWKDGWFLLEGIPTSGASEANTWISAAAGDDQAFVPESITDARRRTLRNIVQRRGQQSFRQALIDAYDGHCAITGCDVVDVLEGAHIHPYRGEETNHPSNGLLLRTDVHTLFDLGLLTIRPEDLRVVLAPRLRRERSAYADLQGVSLRTPDKVDLGPSANALRWHNGIVAVCRNS